MQKTHIIVLSLASVCAFAGVQPAFAEKRRICNWHVTGATVGDFETGAFGLAVKVCEVVDQPLRPTTPWKGTVQGYGTPIQQQKTVRQK